MFSAPVSVLPRTALIRKVLELKSYSNEIGLSEERRPLCGKEGSLVLLLEALKNQFTKSHNTKY